MLSPERMIDVDFPVSLALRCVRCDAVFVVSVLFLCSCAPTPQDSFHRELSAIVYDELMRAILRVLKTLNLTHVRETGSNKKRDDGGVGDDVAMGKRS
jgi:hypothetical protein